MPHPTFSRGVIFAVAVSLLIVTLALALYWFQKRQAPILFNCDLSFSNGVIINAVPLANTHAQIKRGLSGEGRGAKMFFSWKTEEFRTFWMKNTHSDLSIGFFDNDGFLFQIINMEADTNIKYVSNAPALFALELAVGQFKLLDLELGSRLIKKDCQQ